MCQYVKSVEASHDKEIARQGIIIVLYNDQDEIKLLTYNDHHWFIIGYGSIQQAKGVIIPDPDFYYGGIGYTYDMQVGYAIFDEDTSFNVWDRCYEHLLPKRTITTISDNMLFDSLAQKLPIAVFHTDKSGGISSVNRQWKKITGLSTTQCIGMKWVRYLCDENERLRVITEWRRSQKNNVPLRLFLQITEPTTRILLVQASPINASDSAIRYIGTVSDVTGIHRFNTKEDTHITASELINSHLNSYLEVAEELPSLLAYVRSDQRYFFANAAYREWVGQADCIDHTMLEIMGPARYSMFAQLIAGVLIGNKVRSQLIIDGRQRNIVHIPRKDKLGNVRGFYVSMTV
jgi:PAS domain S-box-containing protein